MEHSNIQWINGWSPLPQHKQYMGQFSITLPLLKVIGVLYFYPHFKYNIQLNSRLSFVYLQLILNKVLVWMNLDLS